MLKRMIPDLALFLCMCMVGGGIALLSATNAYAIGTIDQCNSADCNDAPRPLLVNTCLHWWCGDDYAYFTCYGICDGGGYCDCEWTGCWDGIWCQ